MLAVLSVLDENNASQVRERESGGQMLAVSDIVWSGLALGRRWVREKSQSVASGGAGGSLRRTTAEEAV